MFGDKMMKGPVLRREVGVLNVTGIREAVI